MFTPTNTTQTHTPTVLVTGACGEVGTQLLLRLLAEGQNIVTLDLHALPPEFAGLVREHVTGSVTDYPLLTDLFGRYKFSEVYHLAAVLSSAAERDTEKANQVNGAGTTNMLRVSRSHGLKFERPVKFFLPSTIAVYGLPHAQAKEEAGAVREDQFTTPTTLYGIHKLCGELLGRYYDCFYQQLAADDTVPWLDFRCLRFPGLLSAETVPTGGTSDYGPLMIHAAASGKPYACFVRPDTRIPFMAMPDAIEAIVRLMDAPREKLTQAVYNVGAFAPSAAEIEAVARAAFPNAEITTKVDGRRQRIVDAWPADVDDSAARRDWGYAPEYDFHRTINEYMLPIVRARYGACVV